VRFYKSPEEAIKLLSGEEFRNKTMPAVADFCVEHKIVEKKPTIGFDSPDSQVNFDTSSRGHDKWQVNVSDTNRQRSKQPAIYKVSEIR